MSNKDEIAFAVFMGVMIGLTFLLLIVAASPSHKNIINETSNVVKIECIK